MNSQQNPSNSIDAATSAFMRSVGMLAGTFGQSRIRPPQEGELAQLKATCEGLVGLLLQAGAGRDLDTGLDAVGLIARYGTAGLLLRLCRLPGDRVAKRLGILLLTMQLNLRRATGDDVALQFPKAPGVFDLAFSAQNQRTARRCLDRLAQRAGLEGFRLDLYAMWRYGAPPISIHRIRPVEVHPRDMIGFGLLCAYLVLCDLARLGRPVDVLARGAITDVFRRWPSASEAFRLSLSEALLLATSRDFRARSHDDLTRLLQGDVEKVEMDRAGGLVLGFHELCASLDESFTLDGFLGRLVYLADKLAGLETEPEHMRRLDRAARRTGRTRRFQVVELDRPLPGGGLRELADEVHDPQRSVPVRLDLERAMVHLSRGEQVSFLRKLAGSPPKEIARQIGSTPQAVRVMQCRARIKLRQLMSEPRRAS